MRIGVHLQSLRPGEIGGLETYVRQVIAEVRRLDPAVTWVLAVADYNADTFADAPQVEKRVLDAEQFQALDAARLAAWNLDLWFSPLLVLEPACPGVPSVVTIPDLQHETYPCYFSAELLAWRRRHYARSARDADRILTLSAFSRHEIVTRLGVPAEQVVATPLAAAPGFDRPDPEVIAAARARYRLPADYLYFPANAWPHKNHQTLFAALAAIKRRRGRCPTLVLTGHQAAAVDWPQRLAALGIADRVRDLGHLPAAELPALYAGAAMLVFPSRFEGFGMPVVEAMQVGCPVLAADATSLPEVGGDAIRTFDPDDAEALAAAIESLLADPRARAAMARAGRARAARFTWRATAAATRDVFRQAAASARPPQRVEQAPPVKRLPLCVGEAPPVTVITPGLKRLPLCVDEAPPVTVITPSFQQGAFIARTLDSVLAQRYPRLRHWVIDGGSHDDTVAILERYRRYHPDHLSFVSEPDGGQADAVNKGLARAARETGGHGIVGWLNSDDVYRDGALARVVAAFGEPGAGGWLYGRAGYVDRDDRPLGAYPVRATFDWHALAHECFICQPAAFWWPARLDGAYELDRNLDLCLDYDLWIRIGRDNPPRFIDAELAASRIYPENKTLGHRGRVYDEIIGTVKRHYGYVPLSWAAGKAHHLCQREADPLRPGPLAKRTLVLAAALAMRYNWSSARHLRRAAREVGQAAAERWRAGRRR